MITNKIHQLLHFAGRAYIYYMFGKIFKRPIKQPINLKYCVGHVWPGNWKHGLDSPQFKSHGLARLAR